MFEGVNCFDQLARGVWGHACFPGIHCNYWVGNCALKEVLTISSCSSAVVLIIHKTWGCFKAPETKISMTLLKFPQLRVKSFFGILNPHAHVIITVIAIKFCIAAIFIVQKKEKVV